MATKQKVMPRAMVLVDMTSCFIGRFMGG